LKNKRKIFRLFAVILLVLLTVALTGCEKWEAFRGEYELFKQEFPEIAEFFSVKQWSEEPSPHVVLALPDETSAPMLDMLTHTEVIESPFNSADKISTAQSLGDLAIGEQYYRALTETEKDLYIQVPAFEGRDCDEIKAHFESCGVEVCVILRRNTAPAGEVIAINYAGAVSGGVYYVNPYVPVTLYVSDEKKAKTADSGHNLVYLTFDDGPSEDTEKLLDILDTYGVKAAFFTLGTAIEKNPIQGANVVLRGHSLGCHSFSHDYEKIYSSVAALEAEVGKWEKTVSDAGINVSRKIFRFPGGSVGGYLEKDDVPPMQGMLEEAGYVIFDWGVSINDAVLYLAPEEQSSYDYIKESFVSSLEQRVRINQKNDGAPIIILMHEQVDETVHLLPWIIEYLVDRGFVFGDLANFDGSYMFER